MNQVSKSIKYLLDYLKNDPRISNIYHPYYGNSHQKGLANKYLSEYGSLFAIDLADTDFNRLKKFINSLKILSIGVSWDGFESLVLPSFKGNNINTLNERGLPVSHIRIYIGLENIDSILLDITTSLDSIYGKI